MTYYQRLNDSQHYRRLALSYYTPVLLTTNPKVMNALSQLSEFRVWGFRVEGLGV